MKKIFSLFVAFFVFVAVSYAQKGVMKFAQETHDFGKIEQGKPVTHVFEFKNTGSDPVIINDAQASCGCTKPSFSREPIMPGKSGSISATFNAAAPGQFTKTVTVTSNAAASQAVLYLKGEVVSQKEAQAAADAKKKSTKTSR
ncbi:DUF1573 domain-containing protein [Spirosoma sp. KUDC1026]|uniref:DUF1573 domain-containing protein n=1 Tax=Spirosoma sp. KUDC1026 TaxID=2745947 RepID=UPI00159BB09B|nr:DUF1573 domain-containing protein [Spirosoma sp. KUDC1026]QKZ11419.1 DUF1573 domain-containing protein [Spirosoma sp. KUDC1026]